MAYFLFFTANLLPMSMHCKLLTDQFRKTYCKYANNNNGKVSGNEDKFQQIKKLCFSHSRIYIVSLFIEAFL